ncbi:hypothetical protein FisN_20Hu188 [Fistulifera solaris]|jgi:hypothetical protein|uniref:Uncharacterized protein n=1 Tax=Fistulifera solaris TaxID=1519565 RepID=A0A1Z5JJM4_FISSO|nr:hypothetical protein FisN_20Hu188 [Fistulifera solaris]|eukprot:GAX14189.1 hypothetical protein FisN_20Hu188 [Fistulifera solaris]
MEGNTTLYGAIYGETDAKIAKMATLFWSLKADGDTVTLLRIHNYMGREHEYYDQCAEDCKFDFSTFRPNQLAQILDSNPTRKVEIRTGRWTVEQSAVFASRPYPLHLTLGPWLSFKDKGKMFVKILKERKSSFGSLGIDFDYLGGPLSYSNVKRIVELDFFEELRTSNLHKDTFPWPFSANVNVLHCSIEAAQVVPNDFKELEVVTGDLSLKVMLDADNKCDELAISFFNRVAELGHFEKLAFAAGSLPAYNGDGFDNFSAVVEALIRAIRANTKLSYLDLSDTCYKLDWPVHFEAIFQAVEEHKGLRTFVVEVPSSEYYWRNESCWFNYSLLEQLLSRNRYIEVVDSSGKRLSNGPAIDNLYALNRFYCGATNLVKEPSPLRSLLASSALVSNASANFQRTALVLEMHTDVLCYWIQDAVDFDPVDAAGLGVTGNGASSDAHSPEVNPTDSLKRKPTAEVAGVAKKSARDEV